MQTFSWKFVHLNQRLGKQIHLQYAFKVNTVSEKNRRIMKNSNMRIICLALSLCLPLLAAAQQTLSLGQNNYQSRKGVVYNKEVAFNFKPHTNGLAAGLQFGKIKSYNRTAYWGLELGEIKHVKETRQNKSNQIAALEGAFRGFVYGKQNNFYALRLTFGEKRYLSEKARRKGLALGLDYSAGASLGILKPYYLLLRFVPEDFNRNFRSERYTAENEARFLDINSIYGADSFSKGLGNSSFLPGGHAKVALHFDWGAFDEFIKAFEVGIMADFYLKKVPIMVETPSAPNVQNQPLFLNLFLNVQLGKRS